MNTDARLKNANWRKSTHSGINNGDCVEIADNIPDAIPVRDSKNPEGPALHFTPEAWAAFVGALKSGELPFT
jgi:Domain of unknown function (DUF397)